MAECNAARGSGSPKHDYAPRRPTETMGIYNAALPDTTSPGGAADDEIPF
jgi:hypothetical protein